ncbi:MAG: PAS domain S-box protein [Heliobacteriaceae bacterium]|nr:PAS domain S-box protein [Heliobacteriaceae bacterium]
MMEQRLGPLQLLLDYVETQVWYLLNPGTYGGSNLAHANFLGKEKSALKNTSLLTLFDEKQAAVCIEANRKIFETKTAARSIEWLESLTGEKRLLSVERIPKLNAAGDVELVICIGYDITSFKHTEEALKKSEELYRAIVEEQTELICRFRPDTTLTYVNKAYCRYFGKTPEELVGSSFLTLIPPLAHKQIRQYLASFKPNRALQSYEHQVITSGGEIRWQHWTDRAFFAADGRIAEFQSAGRDITQKKLVQVALEEDNYNLEVQVRKRTRELEHINHHLLNEITERKNAEIKLKQSCEKLKTTLAGTVNALSSLVELRDQYTAGHQKKVAELAGAIAKALNLPPDQVEQIYMASLLHDIGKITVPAEILSKPGPITPYEFEMIKAHCLVGYNVLSTIAFPGPIAQIVLQHHERINGSGYPSGIPGDQIRLEARIIAVADVVEAISSHRPYRPALGIDCALREIATNKNVLYDPQIVDVCTELFAENKFSFGALSPRL